MLHEQGGGAEGEATRQENRPYPVGKVILALDDDGMKDADDDEGAPPDEDSGPVEHACTFFLYHEPPGAPPKIRVSSAEKPPVAESSRAGCSKLPQRLEAIPESVLYP